MKLKTLFLSFSILVICFILSANTNLVSAKADEKPSVTDLVVIGTTDGMEILIDERVEILADVQKDELIILTKEVLDQSSLFGRWR